ncbi:MAG: SRPBCC domain-containing protein [Kofleriaceae bacterium]
MKNETTIEQTSERELSITRTFDGPVRLVWEAWTTPKLFGRWWLPKSFGLTLISCEQDIRVGGMYKLVIKHGDAEPRAFFGKYLEVVPTSRLVWTNEEDPNAATTTVTFEEHGSQTRVVMRDLYPTKAALDEARETQQYDGMGETFDQLAAVLAS